MKDNLKLNPKLCKKVMYSGLYITQRYQCFRKTWRDGWCKQHHPEKVAERQRVCIDDQLVCEKGKKS